MIDLENLAKEFDIESNTEDFKIDVEKNLDEVNINDPDGIVIGNLAKANAILDRLIFEMNAGNFSPRMVEVSTQVMGIISDISKQIYKKTVDFENLQMKKLMLELKMKSLKSSDKTINQNIIVTDRETVLKLLKEQKDKKLLENKGEFYDDNRK